jgi:hypothetical protein
LSEGLGRTARGREARRYEQANYGQGHGSCDGNCIPAWRPRDRIAQESQQNRRQRAEEGASSYQADGENDHEPYRARLAVRIDQLAQVCRSEEANRNERERYGQSDAGREHDSQQEDEPIGCHWTAVVGGTIGRFSTGARLFPKKRGSLSGCEQRAVPSCGLTFELSRPWRRTPAGRGRMIFIAAWSGQTVAAVAGRRLERGVRRHCAAAPVAHTRSIARNPRAA